MNQVLLGFGNQWICSLIEFWSLFSQGLMENHKEMLGSSRSQMEKRESEHKSVPVDQNDLCEEEERCEGKEEK